MSENLKEEQKDNQEIFQTKVLPAQALKGDFDQSQENFVSI
jgi:hypothetical protein